MSDSATRTSSRLAPSRRRLSPDDTFHRIDPSLQDDSTLHSVVGVGVGVGAGAGAGAGGGGGAGAGGAGPSGSSSAGGDNPDLINDNRLTDFARQVIEQEDQEDQEDNDEHDIDDGLFHPADFDGQGVDHLLGLEHHAADAAASGTGAGGDVTAAAVAAATATGTSPEDKALTSVKGKDGSPHSVQADGYDENISDDGTPGRGGSKKRRRTLPPLGPGETRDPIQMKKDSHVRLSSPSFPFLLLRPFQAVSAVLLTTNVRADVPIAERSRTPPSRSNQ